MSYRTVIALATAVSAAVPSFAQTSNVRLFGVLDAFVESAHTGQGTVNRVGSGGIFSSRWALAGTEDLGGGLKAGFLLESLVNMDTGALGAGGKLWGRTSTLSLQSNTLGKIEVGRMGTQVQESLATFYMARYGAGNFLYNPNSTMTHDNGLKYTSPALGPVVLQVHYDFGEVAGSNSAGRTISAMGTYKQGPVAAVLGYSQANAPIDIAKANDTVKMATAGVSYDLGLFKPLVLIQTAKSELSPQTVDQYMVNVGADVPIGTGSLRLEYEFVKNKTGVDRDAKALSARYDYPLSKRTILYGGVTKIKNDADVYYPIVGASGSSPVNFPIPASYKGTNPSSVILGIAHFF